MGPELDAKLCEKYPKIFADRHADVHTTAMCWGFECGEGWYNIIDKLCFNIQGHIDWREKTRSLNLEFNDALQKALDGDKSYLVKFYCRGNPDKEPTQWNLDRIEEDIKSKNFRKVDDEIPQVVAVQVKEKFGALRFYYDGGDEYIAGLAAMAESMSEVTCEECGSRGKIRTGGWVRTLCDKHAEEMGYNQYDKEF